MTGWPVASKMWLGDRSLLVNSALSYFQICKNYTLLLLENIFGGD